MNNNVNKNEVFLNLSNEYQLVKAMSEEVNTKNQISLDEVKNLLSLSLSLNKKLVNFIKDYCYA